MPTSYMELKFAPHSRRRAGVYTICMACGQEFYRSKSAWRPTTRFCSRKCYFSSPENNPMFKKKHSTESIVKMITHPNRPTFPSGNTNPSHITSMDPSFRGTSITWWRDYLKRTIGHCQRCGFEDTRILIVHHKDRNTHNNVEENLELLCANCHLIEHYEANDGTFHFMKSEI